VSEIELSTPDAEATAALGAALARAVIQAGCDRMLIDLRGDLGSGKTVFVGGVARGLGLSPDVPVVSPTFTIARNYPVPAGRIDMLHHLDAYRLAGPDDLESVGFEEMCGTGCLTCVEWGAYVEDALPEDRVTVTLRPLPPDDLVPGEAPVCPRAVQLRSGGPDSDRVLEILTTTTLRSEAR